MTIKNLVAATCVAALSLSASSSAFAQAAAPTITHGPALPGVCVMSIQGVISSSTVGKHVQTRMQQILAQVEAELKAEEAALQRDGQALESQKATLDQGTFDTRAAGLQVRLNAYKRKSQQRDNELDRTQQKALGRVGQEMEPIMRQVYQQRQCSVLLRAESVLVANPAMDISPAILTGLNAKITQFAFERERLDQPAAAPQAAAPARK
ncbi:MAG: OmpH family outer membrane protein [Phenylobacterium sp.]|uniref:OmpH family outer membrane protein n=1 Tax=Phenylobacterium sp. TaxID=1871053 RepID=UPI00271B320E|nr:OmpH family outer membrane protein [Phenylobacterium sp.]MDO8911760.1 OmpH family outer membrane protein [Phenylobacterium sp.]MDP2009576.1 OmpH family outer membrane protein [Phenylobacterium sp.]MDP3099921.1 OmpH family outer membrane protein [Phenylobacterium sp.]MDP3631624.1 OmpH family outer membrane protein [Phenylobacterium sp.]MDP3868232.1 OmpH family outer membrane protein [Phenylobacterium sp.]